MADLMAWYNSKEYEPFKKIRQEITNSKMVAVEGL